MIHMNHNSFSCITSEKSDCERIFGQFRLRTRAGDSNQIIGTRPSMDTRNETGVSILYRNCSGKIFGGAEYIDLRE